jgi:hypothetical protein
MRSPEPAAEPAPLQMAVEEPEPEPVPAPAAKEEPIILNDLEMPAVLRRNRQIFQ